MVKAKELQKQGYRVFLLIHSHALSTGRLKSCSPLEGANHWVVLTSPQERDGAIFSNSVQDQFITIWNRAPSPLRTFPRGRA